MRNKRALVTVKIRVFVTSSVKIHKVQLLHFILKVRKEHEEKISRKCSVSAQASTLLEINVFGKTVVAVARKCFSTYSGKGKAAYLGSPPILDLS